MTVTYPITALTDGEVSDPAWFEDITESANDHEDRLLAVEQLRVEAGVNNAGASGTKSDNTYANMSGTTSFNITKVSASTKLYVAVAITTYSTAGSTVQDTAVLIDGTDYQVCSFGFTTANQQFTQMGFRYITSLAANTYTVQLRWKRSAGAGTLTTDTFSWYSVSARECD